MKIGGLITGFVQAQNPDSEAAAQAAELARQALIETRIYLGITVFVVLVMVVLFVQALEAKNKSIWASYLVSVGICGTFSGIVVALLRFDAGNITASIPGLIGGMKIAFISSALGVLLSLYLRWEGLQAAEEEFEKEKTAADIHEALERNTDRICKSVDDFAGKLAKSNSEAFFNALEEAIHDFNEKMSEQFGQNFKQFNEGVGNLLQWQEEYRGELREMMNAFREIEKTFEEANARIADVARQAERFTESAKAFAEISERQAKWLESCELAQTQLEQKLVAFAELGEAAQRAFPVVEATLEKMTRSVQQTTDEMTEEVKRTLKDGLAAIEVSVDGLEKGVLRTRDELTKVTDGLGKQFENIVGGLEQQLREASGALEKGVRDTQNQLTVVANGLGEEVVKIVQSLEQQLLDASARSQQRLEDQVETFDQMLGQELTKSLQSLGSQLATLSGRFVEDYEPLVGKLRRVVEISRRLDVDSAEEEEPTQDEA